MIHDNSVNECCIFIGVKQKIGAKGFDKRNDNKIITKIFSHNNETD